MLRPDPEAQRSVPSSDVPARGVQSTPQRNDTDHAAKSDEYEVVEAEDDEDVEEIPRSEPVARPGLPRLNSQSRASSLVGLGATVQNEPQQTETPQRVATEKEIKTGPVHVRDTREIPIPIPKRSTPLPQPPTIPQALPSPIQSDQSDESDQSEGSYSEDEQHQPYPKIGGGLKMDDTRGPNPTIQIPKVTPVSSGFTLPPNLAELSTGLEGKYVDEFGNILDWNGQVLGRAEGDLPSMIGRPVSITGEILSEDNEVVGYVAENDTIPPAPPSPTPIEGMGGGLKVDHMGNIIDSTGNVVGHFNAEPLTQSLERTGRPKSSSKPRPSNGHGQAQHCSCGSHSKPSSAPNPSEIYLDVKSTTDGIQLIIKIPTVFNNGGGAPTVHIGQT